jgi:glutamate-1-semialdehyde 2,1-aminomutase
MNESFALTALAAALAGASLFALPKAWRRLELSRAKHPSLTGHSRWAKRVAGQVPGYAYDEATFFASDGAPAEVVVQRQAGLQGLASLFRERYPRSLTCSSPAPTVCPTSTRPCCANTCRLAPS